MANENIRKVKLLKIWDILNKETDENNPMSTPILIKKLVDFGIDVDRRTLYKDIKVLNEFGYEILCNRSNSNGYYVMDRSFDIPEIHILMDAVRAASFITEKKTDELINKISQLAGSQRAEVLTKNIVEFKTAKSVNENIYYSVYEITTAITEKKKITFQYFDYDINRKKVYRKDKIDSLKNKKYLVNPLATVFSNDNYYLICYDDKHGDLSNYRVDRMDSVTMTDDKITQTQKSKTFDIIKHKQQLFGMFGGEIENVSFEANKDLIDVIYDKFGENVVIVETSEKKLAFTVEVQISPTFLAWCCSFGDKIEVTSPKNVREKLGTYINSMGELYE